MFGFLLGLIGELSTNKKVPDILAFGLFSTKDLPVCGYWVLMPGLRDEVSPFRVFECFEKVPVLNFAARSFPSSGVASSSSFLFPSQLKKLTDEHESGSP